MTCAIVEARIKRSVEYFYQNIVVAFSFINNVLHISVRRYVM